MIQVQVMQSISITELWLLRLEFKNNCNIAIKTVKTKKTERAMEEVFLK